MKKSILTFICVFLIGSLLLCGCAKENPDNDTSTADMTDAGSVDELDAALYDNDIAQLNLLTSDCFYFKGLLTDENGESNVMEIARKDGNSYMGSQLDGVSIGFMTVDGEYYMIYPDGECALLIDESVSSTMGIDPSDMQLDTTQMNFGDLGEQQLVDTSEAMVDNRLATCRTYQQESGNVVKTYLREGRLVRIQKEDANGALVLVMDVENLSNVVPAGRAALPSGYKLYSGSVGMMTFMMKVASNIDMDVLE